MKVLFISPFYFGAQSVIGGGERYAHELAQAMSKKADTVLLTFDRIRRSEYRGNLRVEYLTKMMPFEFLRWIAWADVIHSHQIRFSHTDAALILGKLLGKKVFLTDLGGGQTRCLSDYLPILNLADGFLMISKFSKNLWLTQKPAYTAKTHVIGGGVDTSRFVPGDAARGRTLTFVGRIVSHKGIDILIDAVDEHMSLEIIGKVYDQEYYRYLTERAKNKPITFVDYVSDPDLIKKYQTSCLVIQPSVHQNYLGGKVGAPELFGLSAAEAMACGAPVIVSDAGSLPELIQNGKTGFVVPSSNPQALRDKINYILQNPDAAAAIGRQAAEFAAREFSWEIVASRCLAIYAEGTHS